MANFKIKIDTKKIEKELNKELDKIIKSAEKNLRIKRIKEANNMNMLSQNAEDMLNVFLKKYKQNNDYSVNGSEDEFPERMRFCIKDTMETLKMYDYISNYNFYIGGEWFVTLTPEALEYFDKKGRRVELFEELVNNEKELLKQIIEIENKNGNISKFLEERVNNDIRDIERGIIGSLDSNGLLSVTWGDDTVAYATLTQAGRTYFEREQKYKEKNSKSIYIYGNQVNIANDNSNFTATQINDITKLDNLIDELKEKLKDDNVDENIRNEIIDNVDGIREEINNGRPRKAILKSLIGGLNQSIKLIPNVLEIGANIASIIEILKPFMS